MQEANNEKLFKLLESKLHDYKNMRNQIKVIEKRIEYEKAETDSGLKGISYDSLGISKSSHNKHSMVEDAIIRKEGRIERLELTKKKIETDLLTIENALKVLDQRETQLFNLYYNSRKDINIDGVAIQMFLDRATVYSIKKVMLRKLINQIYPEFIYQELPLFKELGNI